MSLNEDLCGNHRVDLERQLKEKTIGRPINPDKIGKGTGRIAVSRHYFTGGAEATTAAHMVRQAGNGKYVVRLDSSVAPHTADEVLTLTTAGNSSMEPGTFRIDAVGSDSTVYNVTKLRNRTVQLEGGDNAIYNIGIDASNREIVGHPNAELSVNLPAQA
jgi:hypothetical protein